MVLLCLATHVCSCADCSGSTEGPAQSRWSSSAHPVSGLWWPGSGLPSPPRTLAPVWCTGTGCPRAPSLWPDTTSQTPPPTPHAEATSCVDRKQEGSSVAVSAVTLGTRRLWCDRVDAVQRRFDDYANSQRHHRCHTLGWEFKGIVHQKHQGLWTNLQFFGSLLRKTKTLILQTEYWSLVYLNFFLNSKTRTCHGTNLSVRRGRVRSINW